MLFLRITLFLIIGLGVLVYLLSTKIRTEFVNAGGTLRPLFGGQSADYKAFCKNPPTEYVSKLLKLKKKFSIALMIFVGAFLLAILSVAF